MLLSYTHSFLSTVDCSDPTVPINASIDPYQNTTEGAEVFYRCNPMFVPTGRMRAVCIADGRWTPDPADFVCICELKYWLNEVPATYATIIIVFSELWNSLPCWSCGSRAIEQYHSGFRDSLPVSVRVSTREKDDLSMWERRKVEPWPCYLTVWRQDICTQIALLGKLTLVDMQDCTYGNDSSSCSKLWSSKTSWKWNYCKLHQYSRGVSSALPV